MQLYLLFSTGRGQSLGVFVGVGFGPRSPVCRHSVKLVADLAVIHGHYLGFFHKPFRRLLCFHYNGVLTLYLCFQHFDSVIVLLFDLLELRSMALVILIDQVLETPLKVILVRLLITIRLRPLLIIIGPLALIWARHGIRFVLFVRGQSTERVVVDPSELCGTNDI